MSDDTGNTTREQLLDARLELLRQQMTAGFDRMEAALTTHVKEDDERHAKVDQLEERLRQVELESARESTKLKLIMALMSVGGGGLGAVVSKFLL